MRKPKNPLQYIYRNNFLKSVLTISSGVIIGQAINFVGMPVIGRLYAPEDIMVNYMRIVAFQSVIT